jgi:hypothetical protein
MDEIRQADDCLQALYRRLAERGGIPPAIPQQPSDRLTDWNGAQPIKVNWPPPKTRSDDSPKPTPARNDGSL